MHDDLSVLTRRDLRTQRRRSGARRRVRTLAVTTIVLAASTALGLGAAGTTLALLSAQASSGAATITAGSLDLRINDATAPTLAAAKLSPDTAHAQTFTVQNVGTVGVTLASVITGSTTGIATYTRASVTTGVCTGPVTAPTTALVGNTAPLGELAPGASAGFCLRLGLATDTPATLSGQGTTFTLTINGTQKAP